MQITALLAFWQFCSISDPVFAVDQNHSLLSYVQPQGKLSLEKVPEQIYSNVSSGSENRADAFSA